MHKTETAVSHELFAAPASLLALGLSGTVQSAYKPEFFNATQWRALVALCVHLQADSEQADTRLPEFIDRHMLTPYAHGDRLNVVDPFDEQAQVQQGANLRDLLRDGLAVLDAYCVERLGAGFADLAAGEQAEVVAAASAGTLNPPAKEFIDLLRNESERSQYAHSLFAAYDTPAVA
ncbi:gluconate 2-dehydrogenase subunit 3 family protein [uncultured Pseudomonas sp.]|uniref:gluconate 2-dehydrogenase subunit 3 family protein n=1 Tax=uncultured Pseudomonas sp. TaxID=114707 RepID=UPI0025E7450D|nr:gluconate 2-dehydrogenase subunit 3 family protein [uncultured Pseudomonas sp.]